LGGELLKLCIFTNHFFPENFKVNDIAFEFAKRNHEITVITAIPDYPKGKYYKGYSLFKRRKEVVDGVKIIRLPIIPRGKGKSINLVFNYISYFCSVFLYTLFHLNDKYDAIFVHLTSPFYIGLPAVLIKRKQHIPLIFWVLDLWPESLVAAGGITNKSILQFQMKLVNYVYDNCDRILIGSKGFKESICEKGDYADKLHYFPNWAESIKSGSDIDIKIFTCFAENDFVILFSGNIGEAQNFDSIIDAIDQLRKKVALKFIILGDGRKKEDLENRVIEMGLSDTVFFLWLCAVLFR
jgi:glycosyltransferase involved in cell wall biosynthesis